MRRRWPRCECLRQIRRDGYGVAGIVVYRHAEQMLALPIPFNDPVQKFVVGVPRGFEALLDIFRQNSGAPQKIITQIPALRPDLVNAIQQGHAHDADDERDDEFERGADGNSSKTKMQYRYDDSFA